MTHLPETLTEEETSETQKPPIGTCCTSAPTVVEFDQAGNVVNGWGDPAQDIAVYPRNPHGIFVDHNDFVWIGTYMHHRVQKFTRDGKHVMTIGTYDKTGGSNDTTLLGGPAGIWVDPKTNEVFIADGYRNRRVIVFDGATGKYLRHWGAYGEAPDDTQKPANDPDVPNKQFSTVHGITGSSDGMIYVADRRGNRIQVFDQKGKFIREKIIAPRTLCVGLGVRAGAVAGPRAAVAVSGRRHQSQGLDPAPQRSRSRRRVRPRRPPARTDAAPARDERRLEGQSLRRRSVDRTARAAVHSQVDRLRTGPPRDATPADLDIGPYTGSEPSIPSNIQRHSTSRHSRSRRISHSHPAPMVLSSRGRSIAERAARMISRATSEARSTR